MLRQCVQFIKVLHITEYFGSDLRDRRFKIEVYAIFYTTFIMKVGYAVCF